MDRCYIMDHIECTGQICVHFSEKDLECPVKAAVPTQYPIEPAVPIWCPIKPAVPVQCPVEPAVRIQCPGFEKSKVNHCKTLKDEEPDCSADDRNRILELELIKTCPMVRNAPDVFSRKCPVKAAVPTQYPIEPAVPIWCPIKPAVPVQCPVEPAVRIQCPGVQLRIPLK
ncbi:hypothetical protein TREES_T100014795 [Tupaia chinensis]|uniref:Uncharacterized protein n=1 Tax=Tupaia chinensis TaxID=246437 RepID=L9KTV3_TUPCH|nr:hypothetical protein TREES_T100014795 [Tupaia chinensis]